jgi:hypothetical protein
MTTNAQEYDIEAAAKIGKGTAQCMDWLASAASTATGRASLSRAPKKIAADLLSDDPETRKAARRECITGARAVLERLGL